MPRLRFVPVLLAVIVAVGLTACDDGDSKDASKPHRTTTTSSTTTSTTTTTTIPGSSTTTVPSVTTSTPEQAVGTCGNQTAAIVDAIQGSDVGGLDQRRGQYTVRQCRLASSSPIWAAAAIVPNPGVQLDQATVVLQRIGALWNVTDVGTSGTGCSDTPANIRTELGLIC